MSGVRAAGAKHACTVWPRAGAFPPSSPPVPPILAASRSSSLPKRVEVEVRKCPSLAMRKWILANRSWYANRSGAKNG